MYVGQHWVHLPKRDVGEHGCGAAGVPPVVCSALTTPACPGLGQGRPSGRSRARGSPVTVTCVTWVSASSQERTSPGTFGPTSDTHGITSGPLFPEDLAPWWNGFPHGRLESEPMERQWPPVASGAVVFTSVLPGQSQRRAITGQSILANRSMFLGAWFYFNSEVSNPRAGAIIYLRKRSLENEWGVLQPCCGRHPRTY